MSIQQIRVDFPKKAKNIDFKFTSAGQIKDNKCVACIELAKYDIKKIQTGQYEKGKRDWGVIYSFENNNSN